MNIKIQGGGGGAYANTGSCVGTTNYLSHEDIERMKDGQEQEHFFTHDRDKVSAKEVTYKIDNNKAKLCKNDSKFFVITVSPSKEEIKAMGSTPKEQSANFKAYINGGVMSRYAEEFNKGMTNKDLMYFAKIHHTRKGKSGEQMHAHIIVSRKDITNTKKISPQTNHKKAGKGAVKSGFNRDNFFRRSEQTFDVGFNYKRDFKQSYAYQNTMKNGTFKDIKNIDKIKQEQEKLHQYTQNYHEQRNAKLEQQQYYEKEQSQSQSQSRGRGRGMSM